MNLELDLALPDGSARDVYTVTRLNREARLLIESGFPPLWIEGEISNLARPSSGHAYFCLKDAQAQVRCALFRMQLRLLSVIPREGMHVLVRARVSLYEGRGEYQLIVEHLEEAGEGALRRAFDALKTRLAQEGLFDAARKRPLPKLPRRIGVVTSLSGSVLHDILTTLKRRFPAIPVLVYPVPVQGQGAAEKIVTALKLAGHRRDCDVLLLARGGGSLEDLWPFNEETVARAIVACPIPVVSGVGHETDFTIADLAADLRAPTPTAAAELVSPHQSEWLEQFRQTEARLARLMQRMLRDRAQRIDGATARLVHPRARIETLAHRGASLAQRLLLAHTRRMHSGHTHLARLHARLERLSPAPRLRSSQIDCRHLSDRLHGAVRRHLERQTERLARLAHTLDTVSPLATLDRGYAIVRDANRTVVRDAAQVAEGERIEARLARGVIDCIVKGRRSS